MDDAVAEFVAAHPGCTSVDVFLARVVPDAAGTITILPIMRRLAETGRIRRVTGGDLDLWVDHVHAFPGAHPVGTSLLAEQATRWAVTPAAG